MSKPRQRNCQEIFRGGMCMSRGMEWELQLWNGKGAERISIFDDTEAHGREGRADACFKPNGSFVSLPYACLVIPWERACDQSAWSRGFLNGGKRSVDLPMAGNPWWDKGCGLRRVTWELKTKAEWVQVGLQSEVIATLISWMAETVGRREHSA